MVRPIDDGHAGCRQSGHRGDTGTDSRRSGSGCGPGGSRGAGGVRGMGDDAGGGPGGIPRENPPGSCRPRRGDRPDHYLRGGDADQALPPDPGGAAPGRAGKLRETGFRVPLRRADRQLPRHQGTGRCGCLHHPVELSPAPGDRQGGPGPGCGVHRGPEAERGGAPQRVHPGGGHPRGGSPGGGFQSGERHRRGGRRGAGEPSRC